MPMDKIAVAGAMPKSRWNGNVIREQDFVLDPSGLCMSIPATYSRHPFKILVYEEDRALEPDA